MGLGAWLKRGLYRLPGPWKTHKHLAELTRVSKAILAEHGKQLRVLRRQQRTLEAQRRALEAQRRVLEAQRRALGEQQKSLEGQRLQLSEVKWEVTLGYRAQLTSMHVVTAGLRQELHSFLDGHQLGMLDTLRVLRERRMSMARFGDGELRLMFHLNRGPRFQRANAVVAEDLRKVLTLSGYDADRLLVALPDRMRGDSFWNYTWAEFWPDLRTLLRTDVSYGNAQVSRVEAFTAHRDEVVRAWRGLWDGADACIVTGAGSRFDLREELFSNLRSHGYVLSTPVDAHSDIERVMAEVEGSVPRDRPCLISLGPAGTILAARLAMRGYWAIDIGHLSASYDQAFESGRRPEDLPLINKPVEVPKGAADA